MKQYKKINRLSLVREATEQDQVKANSSLVAANLLRAIWDDSLDIYESFYLILLNRANDTTGIVKISQGGISGTVADTRLIAKYALESLSTAIILAHNHPSGNLKPSEADRAITKKIANALNLFEITTVDHIILTKDSYFSFSDNGLL